MNKLLIATRQKGKLAEFKDILKNVKLSLVTLNELDFPKIEPKENGKNFTKNAIIKAKFYAKKTGLLTLADDSGLQVTALPALLGLKTKRFVRGSDNNRCKKLLKEMENVGAGKRDAGFVSAVALFDPKTRQLKTAIGVCQGEIAFRPMGRYGFGYDPIFIVKNLNKHFAQLTLYEKNRVSHRAKALNKIKKYLKKYEY